MDGNNALFVMLFLITITFLWLLPLQFNGVTVFHNGDANARIRKVYS